MSQHLVAFREIEQERLDVIHQFTELLEDAVDRLVDEQLRALTAQARLSTPRTPVEPRPFFPAPRPSPVPRPMPILPAMPSRTPTEIPAHVTITRLPPGPSPHDRRRSGPPMDCRLPGCLIRSRGPRYEYFCDDHYRVLNPDERKHWADVWRASRQPRPQ